MRCSGCNGATHHLKSSPHTVTCSGSDCNASECCDIKPTECGAGLFLDGGLCSPCIDHCDECDDATTCSVCATDYDLEDNNCVFRCSIENCVDCVNATSCAVCASGFALQSTGCNGMLTCCTALNLEDVLEAAVDSVDSLLARRPERTCRACYNRARDSTSPSP